MTEQEDNTPTTDYTLRDQKLVEVLKHILTLEGPCDFGMLLNLEQPVLRTDRGSAKFKFNISKQDFRSSELTQLIEFVVDTAHKMSGEDIDLWLDPRMAESAA